MADETPDTDPQTIINEAEAEEETKEPEPLIEPVTVIYCGICRLPSEYCEFGPCFDRCKRWIAKNCPELYPQLAEELTALAAEPEEENKTPVPMPGKKKPKVSGDASGSKILITKGQRGGNKIVTTIQGLELFDINLKEAAKMFGKKFACGSSEVKGEADKPNVVNIQGDFTVEVGQIIEEKFKIAPGRIEYKDAIKKKSKAGKKGKKK